MRAARRYSVLLATCSVAVLGACGGSSAEDNSKDRKSTLPFSGIPRIQPTSDLPPKQGRPVQWVVLGDPQGRQLRIGTGFLSFCVEIPRSKPRITAVRERVRRDGVVFTVYAVGGYQSGCAAVAVRPDVVVKTKHPLEDEQLFDGSKAPPIKRWPR